MSPLGRLDGLHHGVICPSSGSLWCPRVISPLPARSMLPCLLWLFDYRSCTSVSALVIVSSYLVQGTKRPPLRLGGWLGGYGWTLSACPSRGKQSSHSLLSCATLEIRLSHLTESLETLQNFPAHHWSLFGNRFHACLLPLSSISAEQHQTVCVKSRMTAVVGKVTSCKMSISTAISTFTP